MTCLGTERGLETRLGPAARVRARADPAGAAAPHAHAAPADRPRPARRRDQHRGGRPRPYPGRRAGRFRRIRRDARLSRRPAPQGPDHRARGEPPAGPGQPPGRAVHRARRGGHPRHPAAARRGRRHPAAPRDRHARPARHGRQGARALRPALRPAHAAGLRRLAGRALAQPRPHRRGARAARGRHPDPAHRRPQERQRARGHRRRPGLHHAAVLRPDGPRLRRRRLRDVPRAAR